MKSRPFSAWPNVRDKPTTAGGSRRNISEKIDSVDLGGCVCFRLGNCVRDGAFRRKVFLHVKHLFYHPLTRWHFQRRASASGPSFGVSPLKRPVHVITGTLQTHVSKERCFLKFPCSLCVLTDEMQRPWEPNESVRVCRSATHVLSLLYKWYGDCSGPM